MTKIRTSMRRREDLCAITRDTPSEIKRDGRLCQKMTERRDSCCDDDGLQDI
jgi:hypothetical protein